MSEAETWALGDYARLAERLAPLYDTIVAALSPEPGEQWLDVATGTGGVAVRAARVGARVTALDVVPTMLAAARASAAEEGVELELMEADARGIDLRDGSFDVVSSCLGFGFDREDEPALNELMRVCRRGGRLGILLWRPDPGLAAALRPVTGGTRVANEQSTAERAHELLDDEFEVGTATAGGVRVPSDYLVVTGRKR